jgi:hypothetical protein
MIFQRRKAVYKRLHSRFQMHKTDEGTIPAATGRPSAAAERKGRPEHRPFSSFLLL